MTAAAALTAAASATGVADNSGSAAGQVPIFASATGEWTAGVNVATFATSLPALSDADLAVLRSAVLIEMQRRSALANTLTQIVNLTNRYQKALGDSPTPVAWTPGTGNDALYGPGVLVTYNGATYRNDSAAVLNGTYVPSSTSPWWTLIPQTGNATPWKAGMPLTSGEYVSDSGGAVWRYNGTAIASAPANWAPANNATWTLIEAAP